MFGGSDNSSAQGQSGASINSSGWVVGKGNASGGTLDSATGGKSLPWYAWASIASVVVAFVYYKNKRGK